MSLSLRTRRRCRRARTHHRSQAAGMLVVSSARQPVTIIGAKPKRTGFRSRLVARLAATFCDRHPRDPKPRDKSGAFSFSIQTGWSPPEAAGWVPSLETTAPSVRFRQFPSNSINGQAFSDAAICLYSQEMEMCSLGARRKPRPDSSRIHGSPVRCARR
jgi:hypothetical protein